MCNILGVEHRYLMALVTETPERDVEHRADVIGDRSVLGEIFPIHLDLETK